MNEQSYTKEVFKNRKKSIQSNSVSHLKSLTTREVARLCRVSDATVKRWEDAGLIKSERTSGGHRRFRAEEIARFQREQGLGQKQSHGGDSVFSAVNRNPETRHQAEVSLFDLMLAGREEAAAEFLIGEYLNGTHPTEIFDEMICPPLRKIGDMWFAGELNVAQEHLATRTIQNAVYKLRSRLLVPEPTGRLAICCALENEQHELPTHLAQVAIENEGWEVLNFGGNTPLYSLREEIGKHLPDLICISATMMNDIERLSRDYMDLREIALKNKISIIAGGKIFRDECVRKRFPADMYADRFAEVAAYARGLIDA